MAVGKLFVVSGPSGAGKSTICRNVRKLLNINLATSATTRDPRDGEKNGIDYYFLTKKEFLKKKENGDFLEYAEVHGHYYGTLKSEVESRIALGQNVILEIDVQGGLQVRAQYPNAKLVFFKTPNLEQLEARLRGRKTDDEATIQLRLKNSLKELEYEKQYDVTIVNFTIDQASNALIDIINKENGKWSSMKKEVSYEELLSIVPNKYILTIICGQRARKIEAGAAPLTKYNKKDTIVKKVLKEVADLKVSYVDDFDPESENDKKDE